MSKHAGIYYPDPDLHINQPNPVFDSYPLQVQCVRECIWLVFSTIPVVTEPETGKHPWEMRFQSPDCVDYTLSYLPVAPDSGDQWEVVVHDRVRDAFSIQAFLNDQEVQTMLTYYADQWKADCDYRNRQARPACRSGSNDTGNGQCGGAPVQEE